MSAKKISQLIQKNNLNDADLFVIRDSVSLDNRSISAVNMKSYFGGGSVDWADITNKPSTFPPSSHTHQLADIADFPTGSKGDVFIHDGTSWQAGDVVIIRNIAWFQANANNVLRKNTIVYLQEDTNCYKVGDGVTTLKNLKWWINKNYGDVSISGYSGIFGRNTATGKDITHSVLGQTYANITLSFSNEIRGSFGFLTEPMTIEQLGIFTPVHNNSGGAVQAEIGIYQPNFQTRQNTLVARTNLSAITAGVNFFPLQTVVTLPSGIYLFAFRQVVPFGSNFQLNYINHFNQIAYIMDNNYSNQSLLYLTNQSSLPSNLGFPNFAGSTLYILLLGQRILSTI